MARNFGRDVSQSEESVSLQGDLGLCNSLVLLKAIWKSLKDQGERVLLELGCIEVPLVSAPLTVLPPILTVVQQFQEVFDSSVGLPLS